MFAPTHLPLINLTGEMKRKRTKAEWCTERKQECAHKCTNALTGKVKAKDDKRFPREKVFSYFSIVAT